MWSLDIFVQNYFSHIRTPFVTEFMYLASGFFDVTASFVAVVLCVAFLVYLVRGKLYSVLFMGSLVFAAVSVYFLKVFFDVARPLDPVVYAFGQSFPSYHATASTVFFVMLMYIFDKHLSLFSRVLFNAACILAIIVVSFSRIYLGIHWLTDVVFGVFFGLVISYVSVMIIMRGKNMHGQSSMIK